LQIEITADWDALGLLFLLALAMAMSISTPQAAKRLPIVRPDVAKTLAVVALCKSGFGVYILRILCYRLLSISRFLELSGSLPD
jgi:hypothetical protein